MSLVYERNQMKGFTETKGRAGSKIVNIDTRKAMWRGKKYRGFTNTERIKFENLFVLNNALTPIHILYDGEKRFKGNTT